MKTKMLLVSCLAAVGVSCGQPEIDVANELHLGLDTVSNLPHLLSGGDALVEITTSAPSHEGLRLALNGRQITPEIVLTGFDSGLNVFTTLIEDLEQGTNTLHVDLDSISAELGMVNYPSSGPIFSGERQQPYYCLASLQPHEDGTKRRFAIGNGEFLDDRSSDDACSLSTRVDYVYKSADPDVGFLPYDPNATTPSDLSYTATTLDSSRTLPYIVRIETGTINRAIYQIAMLHDPATGQPGFNSPSPAWNERLVYAFGGGCEAGYFQGNGTAGVLRDDMLAKGYAIASSTLNVNAQGGCNDVLSAETAMMVKEHFIERYGEPRYTIGNGGSGGAMQQLLIAGAYPGILDGIIPSLTFADAVTYFTDAQECAGLLRDYVNAPDSSFDDSTKNLIGGWSMWSVCDESLGLRPKRVAPDDCPAQLPPQARYHPVDNPNGARCSIYDGMRNIFGEKAYPELDIDRRVAKAPHDNVGVQYGLATLNAGHIDVETFLDLNQNIGGWDIDVNPKPGRTVGDLDAIRIAYETGRVTSGGAGLSVIPIIDDRSYLDDIGNFHASVYSFVTRARLLRDNGHADNYVLRRHGRDLDLAAENLQLMDEWLANIEADGSVANKLEKIVRNKPTELRDDCFAPSGERIVETPQFDTERLFDNTAGACNQLFPPHAGLRLVAGGPLSNDVLKCQLKAIDFEDYRVEFSPAQRQRLMDIFPEGVCDWSKPGVHQQVNQTWLSYGPSPVNRYTP